MTRSKTGRLTDEGVCAETELAHIILVRDALDALGREENSPEAFYLLVDAAGILAANLAAWHPTHGCDGALHATARGYRITTRRPTRR